jgi:hypothetical protein
MSKKKDRNASTDLLLRNFNLELLEKLKAFTGEKTANKAIKLVCARYLGLEKLCDNQGFEIKSLKSSLKRNDQDVADFVDCFERLKVRSLTIKD